LPPKTQNPDKSKKRLCRVNNRPDPSESERPDGVFVLIIKQINFWNTRQNLYNTDNKQYRQTLIVY